MTHVLDDLLTFNQETKQACSPILELEEFEAAVRDPLRTEINELRKLITTLSEQVLLLQKEVEQNALVLLPHRQITVAVSATSAFGISKHYGSFSMGMPVPQPVYIALEYCLFEQRSKAISAPVQIKAPTVGVAYITIPAGHTISVSSARWKTNTDADLGIDATDYIKATGIERW